MKKLREWAERLEKQPSAKIIACVLFVVSLTVFLFCMGRVNWLLDQGGYQENSYDNIITRVTDQMLSEKMTGLEQDYSLYRQGDRSVNLASWDNDENFIFSIRNEAGDLLAGHQEPQEYRAKKSSSIVVSEPNEQKTIRKYYPTEEARNEAMRMLEEKYEVISYSTFPSSQTNVETDTDDAYFLEAEYIIRGEAEEVTVTGFIPRQLSSNNGTLDRALSQAGDMYQEQGTYLVLLLAGAVLALASLTFLIWQIVCRTEDLVLRWVDRKIPTDLMILAGLIVLLIGLSKGLESYYGAILSSLFIIVLAGALLLGVVLSLVRRWKAGTLLEMMFFRRVAGWLRRAGHWAGQPLGRMGRRLRQAWASFLQKLPLVWGAGVVFLVCCGVEAIIVYGCSWEDGFWVLWCMLKIVEAVAVFYVIFSLLELQKGGKELAAGNLTYQIPLKKLHWVFREHGENLGNIRQAIQNAVEVQLKSERMKTELITNVSHDIKTPLTSIVSYVDLLKKQEMPTDEAREYLEVLDRQSARLKKLTEDLVEASKASTGNLNVDFQPTDVNVLLTQSAGEYEERLKDRDLILLLTPAAETPSISADGRLLWRVFENLLSNIYKYAQPGTRVYLTCQETADTVSIVFRNISAAPLNLSPEELTDRFVRGDASRNTEGSGLGLSIAQSLTQLQKGTFEIIIDGDLFKVVLTFPRLLG